MTRTQNRIMREDQSLRTILSSHPEVRREVERAYRRGYSQGVFMTLRNINDGHEMSALEAWYLKVFKWRYRLNEERVPAYLYLYPMPPEMPNVKRGPL